MATNVRAVVSMPDHPYYLWQALVQAVELKRLGIPATYLVYSQQSQPSAFLRKFMDADIADWHVWKDWRKAKPYNPSMKPGLVAKWLAANPAAVDEPFVLLDPDAIPTRQVVADVNADLWPGTDTDSYTGSVYLKSKPGVWESLCALIGVDPGGDERIGVGAQLVAVGQPAEFWRTVEERSVRAYEMLGRSGTDVQVWCAEMYVTALEAERRGITLVADPALSMVWANGPVSGWETCGFFHCAGVTEANGADFCKLSYQRSPWGQPIAVSAQSASARYVAMIAQAERSHPDLVWV